MLANRMVKDAPNSRRPRLKQAGHPGPQGMGIWSARYCGCPFGDHGASYESRVTAALVVCAEHEDYD